MNQYICRVCKGNECTVLTSQGPPNCGCLHNSDIGALWEQDSSYKSERDTVLELLEDLRKYANGEYKEADLSDNEHDLRIHLEYENRIWGIMKELRPAGR